MQKKELSHIVLLSGGLDSVVNLYKVCQKGDKNLALFFDYGQKARRREKKAAYFFARRQNIPLQVLRLPWFSDFTKTALLSRKQRLPKLSVEALDNFSTTSESAKNVWVPNRNGIFLNIAAAYAEGLGINFVVCGFNKEEATTFPDNSSSYMESANATFAYSTKTAVQVISYTINQDKRQIAQDAISLGVVVDRIWSCYGGGKKPCRQCESCLRYQRAFHAL